MRPLRIFAVVMITAFTAVAVVADSGETARIRSVVGSVSIIRGGSAVEARLQGAVHDGDVIRAAENSLLELETGKGAIVSVRGPRTFRADLSKFQVRMNSGSALYLLYRRFSRDEQLRPPMTIVAAVRSRDASVEARKTGRDFEKAVRLLNERKDDEAWRIFSRIGGSPYLTAESREQAKFYRAGILFRKGRYAEALSAYEELSGSQVDSFAGREDSHASAILCAEHAGRYDRMNELAREYLSRYAERGKYSESVRELVQTVR